MNIFKKMKQKRSAAIALHKEAIRISRKTILSPERVLLLLRDGYSENDIYNVNTMCCMFNEPVVGKWGVAFNEAAAVVSARSYPAKGVDVHAASEYLKTHLKLEGTA